MTHRTYWKSKLLRLFRKVSRKLKSTLTKQSLLAVTTGFLTGFWTAFLIITADTGFRHHLDPHTSKEMNFFTGPEEDPGDHDRNEDFHRMQDPTIADKLYRQVRVLCWVLTAPENHEKRAKHVKATWGKRCNVLLFMSSEGDASLPAIQLPVSEGRKNLWKKTREAFKYVYEHHLDDADWFLKADDDTYVILENLRYFLLAHSTTDPVYFGNRFRKFINQGYMSGGAGYVLSREAVRRLVEIAFPNANLCSQKDGGSEDVKMGFCLQSVNVKAGDSRDSLGRHRFFSFVPEHQLIPGHVGKTFWYWKYSYYENHEGMNCTSDNAVSFHYITPNQMYVLDYLIYHLRPYGIAVRMDVPPGLTVESLTST